MERHASLKSELDSIAKILEKLPEAVRPQAFDLLVRSFLGQELTAAQPSIPEKVTTPKPKKASRRNGAKKLLTPGETVEAESAIALKPASRPKVGKESYSIDGKLNLRGNGGSIPSFKEFHGEKLPRNAQEFNTVAVYYLEKLAGVNPVSLNHVYTCYTEARKKPPLAFRQSFTDTKNKTAYIEFSVNEVSMTHRGQIFVEHDLPPGEVKK
ncbi:hypothetical protein J7E49_21480 [Variovorax paradoxus]|nr:hypothetical protein [Variovorax paradoxus]